VVAPRRSFCRGVGYRRLTIALHYVFIPRTPTRLGRGPRLSSQGVTGRRDGCTHQAAQVLPHSTAPKANTTLSASTTHSTSIRRHWHGRRSSTTRGGSPGRGHIAMALSTPAWPFEALKPTPVHCRRTSLIILNDNDMSISRTSAPFPTIGPRLVGTHVLAPCRKRQRRSCAKCLRMELARRSEDTSRAWFSGTLFEEMGSTTSSIDGHDVKRWSAPCATCKSCAAPVPATSYAQGKAMPRGGGPHSGMVRGRSIRRADDLRKRAQDRPFADLRQCSATWRSSTPRSVGITRRCARLRPG